MSLIKKPGAEVFRDTATVRVARGTRTVAVEGGGAAMRTVGKLWLGMILAVFILSGLGALASAANSWRALLVLPILGAAVWALVRLFRAPSRATAEAIEAGADEALREVSVPLPQHLRQRAAQDGFRADYWPRGLCEKAALLGVVGLVLTVWIDFVPFTVVGIALLARGALVLSPLLFGRACVVGDGHGLTVHSLLDKKTLAWTEIDNAVLRTFPRQNFWVAFSTGTRRHLVISGQQDFARAELLIPYQLLGLDEEGAKLLARRIMETRGAAGPVAHDSRALPTPAVDPLPVHGATPEAPFDPDAIMARYLAERDRVVEQSALPPVRAPQAPRGFGRKGLAG